VVVAGEVVVLLAEGAGGAEGHRDAVRDLVLLQQVPESERCVRACVRIQAKQCAGPFEGQSERHRLHTGDGLDV
jgi:hypothetical protein